MIIVPFFLKQLLLFSYSVVSNSLWPQGLQHSRLPCSSVSFRVCSNSCPLSQWCHPTISSSVTPFPSCPQSFPASGSFSVSWLFTSCSQRIGASTSASVLPMSIQGWFPLGYTHLFDLLAIQGSLKSLLQDHLFSIINSLALSLLYVQLSHLYVTTGKNIALTRTDLCQRSDVSAF